VKFGENWGTKQGLRCTSKVEIFFTLSITSIFGPMYGVVNVGKKITNYTV
jgi:hypothetical protein